jgi:hypothetical protein
MELIFQSAGVKIQKKLSCIFFRAHKRKKNSLNIVKNQPFGFYVGTVYISTYVTILTADIFFVLSYYGSVINTVSHMLTTPSTNQQRSLQYTRIYM